MKRGARTPPLPTRLKGPGESPGFLLWKIVLELWELITKAAVGAVGLLSMVTGGAIWGPIADGIGISEALYLSAGLSLVSTLVLLCVREVRTLRTA